MISVKLGSYMQVWLSYAQFEMTTGADDSAAKCRNVYKKANDSLKDDSSAKEERVMLRNSMR